MATFIPHPPDDENRLKLSLEQAKDFASRFCQPKDNDLVEDIDESAREAAWRLLQALEETQHLNNENYCCDKCKEREEEKESAGEEEAVENGEETNGSAVVDAEKPSTIEKLSEITENNKGLITSATKTVAGVGVVVATAQTAAADVITAPGITGSIAAFVQETSSKVAAIGTAGIMSVGSGAYFQAKTAGTEGMEVAVVTEQQYGVFSKINNFTNTAFGVSAFENIIEYAEEGYGDVEGSGPPLEEAGDAYDNLSPEEKEVDTSAKEAADKMFGLDIKWEAIKKPPTVTEIGD